MDSYLESLVKKETEATKLENPTEEVVEEATEEVSAVTEEVEEATEASVQEADEVEVTLEPEPIEPEPEATLEPEPILTAPDVKENGEQISVTNIKVYKTPDMNQIAKNISGVVVYRGQIGGFTAIDYMKHGFGMVRGYTPDL